MTLKSKKGKRTFGQESLEQNNLMNDFLVADASIRRRRSHRRSIPNVRVDRIVAVQHAESFFLLTLDK